MADTFQLEALSPAPAPVSGPKIAALSQWWPGRDPCVVELGDAGPAAGICWVDIDIAGKVPRDPGQQECEAAGLYASVEPLCGSQLELQMLVDLLECAARPEDRSYRDGQVRLVVACEAETREAGIDDAAPGALAGARMLVCQPVGFLAGDGWVITCWHRRQGYEGALKIGAGGDPRPHGDIFGCVAKRWRDGPARSAGDLGVLILNELVLSYAPAHRKIYDWLEAWELALYLDSDVDGKHRLVDRTTLPGLWGTMAVLRNWISPLNRAGMRTDIDKAWFAGCTDHEAVKNVNDRIDRALQALRDLGTTLRSSFGLLHIQLTEQQHERTERLQRLIEYITAAVLIPALVVGFYGSNTKLPGQGTWWGFWAMVCAMAALGTGSLLALRIFRGRHGLEAAAAADHRARARAGLAQELTLGSD